MPISLLEKKTNILDNIWVFNINPNIVDKNDLNQNMYLVGHFTVEK